MSVLQNTGSGRGGNLPALLPQSRRCPSDARSGQPEIQHRDLPDAFRRDHRSGRFGRRVQSVRQDEAIQRVVAPFGKNGNDRALPQSCFAGGYGNDDDDCVKRRRSGNADRRFRSAHRQEGKDGKKKSGQIDEFIRTNPKNGI